MKLKKLKLESLNLDKFREDTLKKEQMFKLHGGDLATGAGRVESTHNGQPAKFDYGYDALRYYNGQSQITYHNRSNITYADANGGY